MSKIGGRSGAAVLAAAALSLTALAPSELRAAQAAKAHRTQTPYSEGLRRAGIEPHSTHPSGKRPYAVCPPPSGRRLSCLAAVVPERLAAKRRATLGGPLLEGSGERGGYSPADLRSAYNLPSTGGAGVTVAITIAYDYPKAEADLAVYRETYGLPPCTAESGCFRKVNQRGEEANYPRADREWAAEAALDLDMVSATCPQCHILLIEADSNHGSDLFFAVEEAAILGADVISNSWAGREYAEEATDDHYFDQPGIPVLFASGDWGYGVYYPAASPNVVAVGGTSLRRDPGARGWRESAWAGAGSGCSAYEEKPVWQDDPGCGKRSVADVSAVADPQTPVSVYDTYGAEYQGWHLFGGTSVATPILAGVEALSSAADRAKGAALFWEEGPEGKLFDPGEGRNGPCHGEVEYLCLARLGYDGPTGWGTPGRSRPGPPEVATYDPTDVRMTEATLNGAVDPNGKETSYRFEYGPTSSYGSTVPIPDGTVGFASEPLDLTAGLSGLQRNVTYHYRLAASNSEGTTYGGDRTFRTSLWSVQYMPRNGEEEMFGVSCPAPNACVSAGQQFVPFDGREGNNQPLVERWDGSEWTREAVPVYHASAEGYASWLRAVSCSSPGFCMAVGTNYERHVGYQPLVERWDGGEWTLVPAPMPSGASPNPWNGQRDVVARGVSCSSAISCVLVGEFTKSWDPYLEMDMLIERWDGNSWTVQPSPNPPGHRRHTLWGVSCPSTTFCIAVGGSREPWNSEIVPLIERWDGTQWTIEASPGLSGGLQDVSCISESWCVAVGGSEGEFGGSGIAAAWDGSSWSDVSMPWPMRGVSCLAVDWCLAVGGDDNAHASFAAIWNGARWIPEEPVTPVDASLTAKEMNGVACQWSGCTAVGWYWSWGPRPLTERLYRSLLAPRPTVENGAVSQVTQTSATLSGNVENHGGVGGSENGGTGGSDCHFELALKSAANSPIAEPRCNPDPVEGDASVAVDAQVTGLQAGTPYVYRVVAANEGGMSKATPSTEFTTLPNPPTVSNDPASSVTWTAATLHGHVDNEGATGDSSCRFMVALESAPAVPVAEPPCSPDPVTGDGSVAVEATVNSLSPNRRYVYRVIATNVGGTSTGSPDQQFRTSPNPPAVANNPASSIRQTTAVLRGHVDNEGADAGSSCKFVVVRRSVSTTSVAEPPAAPTR